MSAPFVAPSEVSPRPPRPSRPGEPLWENFPDQLTVRHQWVNWRYVVRDPKAKPTKVLFQPNGKAAKVNEPATWSPFEHCQIAYLEPRAGTIPFAGVGYVLSGADPFCGFDFDHCRNPETGEIDPLILSYVLRLNSYSEISPSGTGLRVLVQAKLPEKDRRLGGIEMYDSVRFLSITGNLLSMTLGVIQ
jgi:putative DNA primase/helicase